MTTAATMTQITKSHFGSHTAKALKAKGVQLINLTTIPDFTKPLPYASGETGYVVDDNGTNRVFAYTELRALAG